MSNTKELLSLADPIFKEIEDAVRGKNVRRIEELFNSPPPVEWVRSYDSEIYSGQKYYGFDIELLEAIVGRVFDSSYFKYLDSKIVQDKGFFASSTTVRFSGKFQGLDYTWITIGSACEPSPNISQLKLAVPKSLSSARGSAIRDIGSLFGRDLNRETDNLPVTQIKGEGSEIDKEYTKLKEEIEKCEYKEQAHDQLKNTPFKYHPALKKIVESKPAEETF